MTSVQWVVKSCTSKSFEENKSINGEYYDLLGYESEGLGTDDFTSCIKMLALVDGFTNYDDNSDDNMPALVEHNYYSGLAEHGTDNGISDTSSIYSDMPVVKPKYACYYHSFDTDSDESSVYSDDKTIESVDSDSYEKVSVLDRINEFKTISDNRNASDESTEL